MDRSRRESTFPSHLVRPLNPYQSERQGCHSPARSPASVSGQTTTSDRKASADCSTVTDTWFISASPDRQRSSDSTVASESDFYLPPPVCSPEFSRKLYKVRERRGWHYFFRYVIGIPIALIVGLLLGAALVLATVYLLGGRNAASVARAAWLGKYSLEAPPSQVPQEYMMAPKQNNSCLIPNIQFPPGPQNFDACGFVIQSTDAIWNLRGDVEGAIDKYFHKDYVDAGSWGKRVIGKKALKNVIFAQMRAFPDLRIHITDCMCKGNDINGYKCAMPDVLTGTNLGPSAYGPATGRYARWTGMVQSLVQKDPASGQWQYVAEWGVHDEWALVQQLGLDFARVPHPWRNAEPLHDCEPLLKFTPKPIMDSTDEVLQSEHIQESTNLASTPST